MDYILAQNSRDAYVAALPPASGRPGHLRGLSATWQARKRSRTGSSRPRRWGGLPRQPTRLTLHDVVLRVQQSPAGTLRTS
eukprot:1153963-Amphidinium_carterae.1